MQSWQRTLAFMFVAQLLSAVGFSTIFPFLPLYVESLGMASPAAQALGLEFWVGAVFSVQGITMMLSAPIWGALADRFGRKMMVRRAMFGGSVIILLMAFADSVETLIILRAIQGMVTGVVAANNALVASVAPRERMGYAMGMMQMGLWSGVAVGPLIGGVMADFVGFEAAFILTAVLLFLGGLLVHFGVKEYFTPRVHSHGYNFLADWQQVMATPGVSSVYLIRFVVWLGRNVIIPFAPLFMASLLADGARVGTFTGLMIGVASATGTGSAIYLGRLADRIGAKRVLVVSAVFAALFYLPQGFVESAWQLIVLQGLTGAAFGGIMPSLSALLSLYTQTGEEGAVYGLDNAVMSGGRAAAPLLGAALVFTVGFRGMFVATGGMLLATALLALWILPETHEQTARAIAAQGD